MQPISDAEAAVIETTRNLTRTLIAKLAAKGAEPADATIGLAYALHDAASELTGNPVEAVEWMRNATDLMEQQLMGGNHAPTSH